MPDQELLVGKLSDRLEKIGMAAYLPNFIENDLLEEKVLEALTIADLENIGISSLGHRKTLLLEFAPAKEATQPPVKDVRYVEINKTVEVKDDSEKKSPWVVVAWLIVVVLVIIIVGSL